MFLLPRKNITKSTTKRLTTTLRKRPRVRNTITTRKLQPKLPMRHTKARKLRTVKRLHMRSTPVAEIEAAVVVTEVVVEATEVATSESTTKTKMASLSSRKRDTLTPREVAEAEAAVVAEVAVAAEAVAVAKARDGNNPKTADPELNTTDSELTETREKSERMSNLLNNRSNLLNNNEFSHMNSPR